MAFVVSVYDDVVSMLDPTLRSSHARRLARKGDLDALKRVLPEHITACDVVCCCFRETFCAYL